MASFSRLSVLSIVFGALLSACSDQMLDDSAALPPDDGRIRFLPTGATDAEETRALSDAIVMPSGQETMIGLECATPSLKGLSADIAEYATADPASSPSTRVWTNSAPFGSFSVSAFTSSGKLYFTDDEVSPSGSVWETKETHFWPEENLDFYAYTPVDGLTTQSMEESEIFFTVAPRMKNDGHDAEGQDDIMMAFRSCSHSDEDIASANGCVGLQFNHAMAGICFVADEADPSFTVDRITLKGIYGSARGEYVPTNTVASSKFIWTYIGKPDAVYSQDVSEQTACEVPVSSAATGGKQRTISALASPFMVIPQRNMDNAEVEIEVTDTEGESHILTASLSMLDRIRAGRMYVVTVSRRNALYPPVENLEAAAGSDNIRGNVVLTWDNPPERHLPDVYIYRIYIVCGDGEEKYRYVNANNRRVEDGIGYVSQPSTVTFDEDIYIAREFEYMVYVDYINLQDYVEGDPTTLHRSIGRHVSLSTQVKTDVPCAFYLPRQMDVTRPVDELPDDDDKEAANWYRRNVARGRFVNNLTLDALDPARYPVLWIPSGVAIHNNLEGHRNGDYNFGRSAAEAQVRNIREYFGDGDERPYFNEADIAAIRRYYEKGGNLLLTNFSVALVRELGVIPGMDTDDWRYMPNIRFYNELKDPMVWFLRANFEGHAFDRHPLYRDVTRVDPQSLRDYWLEHGEDMQVDGTPGVPMYPLLSGSAGQCENNNIVWDFTDGKMGMSMDDFERDCNMRFIGTWGQVANKNVGTVAEFYPRTENRSGSSVRLGRVMAIGLGAFEFSNGLFYDYFFVQNRYQTNVQLLTANALEYLQSRE